MSRARSNAPKGEVFIGPASETFGTRISACVESTSRSSVASRARGRDRWIPRGRSTSGTSAVARASRSSSSS